MELKNRTEIHWARKIWHALPGVVFVAIVKGEMTPISILVTLTGCLFALSGIFEYVRLNNCRANELCQKYFKCIMREDEKNKITGIPAYLGSMFLLLLLFDENVACLSILFLALGDPIASVVGIYSSKKLGSLFKINGKNALGTVSFVFVCLASALIYLYYYSIEISNVAVVGGAIIGGLVELLNPTKYINDNFSIPIMVALTMYLLQ